MAAHSRTQEPTAGKVLAGQVWAPEFRSPTHVEKPGVVACAYKPSDGVGTGKGKSQGFPSQPVQPSGELLVNEEMGVSK